MRRLLLVLAGSTVLHLALLQYALPLWQPPSSNKQAVTLSIPIQLPPLASPAAWEPAAPPPLKVHKKMAPAAKPLTHATPDIQEPLAKPAPETQPPSPPHNLAQNGDDNRASAPAPLSQNEPSATSLANHTEPTTTDIADSTALAPPFTSAEHRFDPPPPARLEYTITGQSKGLNYHASGISDWQINGQEFTFSSQASILIFYSFEFKTVGRFDRYGLAPIRYTDRRGRRPEQAVNFNRDREDAAPTLSFSASTQVLPLEPGTQDRNSVLMQLSGLARGEPDQFTKAETHSIYIAGNRDAEWWTFLVNGFEDMTITDKTIRALHLSRKPRKAFDQTIDIWFAPEMEWYPVKIKFTETNGDFIEQTLSNIVKY